MDGFFKNIHIFIILYGLYNLYIYVEEKDIEIANINERISELENKKQNIEKKLNEVVSYQENLVASRERVRSVIDQVQKLQRQLPSQVNDVEIQQKLETIASELKMKNFTSSPSKEVLNDFYFQKEYKFSGEGTFLQSIVYFEQLGKQERILNVKDIKIASSKESSRGRYEVLKFEGLLESYRYNQGHDEGDQLKKIEEKFK